VNARRRARRVRSQRDSWRSVRDGFGWAGAICGGVAAVVLCVGSIGLAPLGTALALLTALLFGSAAYAALRADRAADAVPPVMASRPAPGAPLVLPLPPDAPDVTVDLSRQHLRRPR
jgi:hypothetical protein